MVACIISSLKVVRERLPSLICFRRLNASQVYKFRFWHKARVDRFQDWNACPAAATFKPVTILIVQC